MEKYIFVRNLQFSKRIKSLNFIYKAVPANRDGGAEGGHVERAQRAADRGHAAQRHVGAQAHEAQHGHLRTVLHLAQDRQRRTALDGGAQRDGGAHARKFHHRQRGAEAADGADGQRAANLVRVSPDKFFKIFFGTFSFINIFFEDFVILEIKFFSLTDPPFKHQYFSQIHAVYLYLSQVNFYSQIVELFQKNF